MLTCKYLYPPPCRRPRRALLFRPSCGLWCVVLEGPPPLVAFPENRVKLLFWLFHSSVDISTVLRRQLKRFGSDFGTQNPSQNGSWLRFEVLKDVCWVERVQNDAICCVVQWWSLHANVHFHCKNSGVLNDFNFACCLVNAILFLSNLSSKSLKMKLKLDSKGVLL